MNGFLVRKYMLLGMLGATAAFSAAAQTNNPEPQQRGWRKVTDPAPGQQAGQSTAPDDLAPPVNGNVASYPGAGNADVGPYPSSFPASAPPEGYPDQQPAQPAPVPPQNYPSSMRGQQPYQYPPPNYQAPRDFRGENVPPQLTIKPGTFISVRVNNPLSSDRNQQGDSFTATLTKPVVVDGFVVARAGETIAGRVTEAERAGRVSGTSRLGVQLTELTLVDGTQVPIQSDLMSRNGRSSVGSDAGAIGATTAVGAAIGAAADWGRGAAIGAGAGAAAGIIGVLLTRGQPTVIYPETMLTFRIGAPITVSTDRAPQAFRYANSGDYGRELQPRTPAAPRVAYGPVAPPYYGPYPYAYGPAAVWGPSFGVYIGRGYRGYRRW